MTSTRKSAAWITGYLCCMIMAVLCGSCLLGCTPQPSCPCVDCDCDNCGPDCPCDPNCCDPFQLPMAKPAQDAADTGSDAGDCDTGRIESCQTPVSHKSHECLTADERPREGVYTCMRCRQKKVGADWHSIYLEGGGVATYLCERCWSHTTPSEREQFLHAYLDKNQVEARVRKAFLTALRSQNL